MTTSEERMSQLPAVYADLQPSEVWRHFGALNQIPRPSGHEEAARAFIQHVAEEHRAMWKVDAFGNIVLRVTPRGARADAPVVVVQSHLDMVCQKRPGVDHDFDKDPIVPRRDDDRIYASGTTLGADNGLGVALALALLTTDELKHGPLELLFTTEEETGLYGATHLDPELVRGRLLVNLDSEDPDELTVGCAGGAGTTLRLKALREVHSLHSVARTITVSGLQGGHSGVQIHERLANALKVLSAALSTVVERVRCVRLVSIEGGNAGNAIPRDAEAVVIMDAGHVQEFEAAVRTAADRQLAAWKNDEPGLAITSGPAELNNPFSPLAEAEILRLLRDLPHGVWRYSDRYPGVVETSSNLAEVHTQGSEIGFNISSRSFLGTELQAAQDRVASIGRNVGAEVLVREGYPGWEPSVDSRLLRITQKAFVEANGKPPQIKVVHAGLECGILSTKLPGLEAVSFGPLIRGAHTPEEYVGISSVETTWKTLTALLRDLA